MEYTTLNNGVRMPMVGLGVFNIPKEETADCVAAALRLGYRLIDTATAYRNEREVGDGILRAMRQLSIPREEIFLTTKVWVTEFGYEKTRASVLASLEKLQTDYLDLVLLHQCLSDYYGAWRALEALYEEGRIRAIGVSNFSAERMVDLCTFNRVTPAVDQVETHLFFQQEALHGWMQKYHVQHEAWGPLAEYRRQDVFSHPVMQAIAAAHAKTPAQIALRHTVQRGIVVIPKSVREDRLRENLDLFSFALTDAEMAAISALDEDKTLWTAYDDPNIVDYEMD